MKRISILGVLLVWCAATYGQNLVPQPVSVEKGAGMFALNGFPHVGFTGNELAPLATYLAGYLPGGRVELSLDPLTDLPAEGYRLEVRTDGATITGGDYGGVWNGIQTFLQLLPPEVYSKSGKDPGLSIPAVTIEDWPALPYRGVMLDVARTFVPKEDVMRLIDNISRHKINRLHWHLADDEGWRIEIKNWPRLAEVGGFRGGDSPVMPVYGAWDRKYGGYYTQDDIREVVGYAAVRNVEIIPEIDLPGHSRAAAIACPEILCGYTPDLEPSAGYDIRNVWCAAREENYAMLDNIISEMAALFPSEHIHLGGDEVSSAQWAKCPHCKALMQAHGITDPARLEDVFMERVIDIAARHGKKAGVWNEAVASGKLPRSTTVYGWESIPAARRAAAAGYPTVVCAGEYFYFDMRQSPADRGHIWAGVITLEKVYSFDPAKAGSTAGEIRNLRGVEATFFSELLLENGPGFLDYQLFPRVCALAEVAWTPPSMRSWSDFERRLHETHFGRLAAMGIGYCASPPQASPRPAYKTPAVTFTSSLREGSRHPFSGVGSYKAAAWTTTACREGDWLLWTFATPVTCSVIEIKTGYDHLQRAGFPAGRVEVSYDGVTFETAAGLHDLKASVTPARPVRAIRVVSASHGNGEDFVIVQPLKIR